MMSALLAARTLPLTELSAWKPLLTHYQEVRVLHLRQLFADDPQRGAQFTLDACGLYLDYSKNRITAVTQGGNCGPPVNQTSRDCPNRMRRPA